MDERAERSLASPFIRYRTVLRRAATLILLSIALALIFSSEPLHDALIALVHRSETVISHHPVAGALLFVGLTAVSAMATFFSVVVIVPAVVFAWGEPVGLGLLWLGWILGGIATYGIGRFLGRPLMQRLTKRRTAYQLESTVQRGAPFWVVLALQLALPSEIPGYLLGLARYPFTRYLLALGIAELPYSVATIYLGTSLLENRSTMVVAIGASIAVLSVAAFHILRHITTEPAATPRSRSMKARIESTD